jgi:hypothetical protein
MAEVNAWIIALRIDQTGRNILDYLLLPATKFPKERMEFSERNQARLGACRFDTVDDLLQSILRIADPNRDEEVAAIVQ